MTARLLAACLALTAGACTRSADAGGTVPQLIRRCVDAYGGAEAIRAAAGVVEEGTVTSILHPGVTGRIARAYQRPGRLRVEIAYPAPDGSGEVRVLDGTRGWRDGREVEGPPLTAMVLQAARLDVPALLSAPGAKVADRGTWKEEGSSLRVLAVEVAPGTTVEAGIDPGTGRILRTRTAASGPGFPIEFVTTYSDFRRVGGVLFAFREGNQANGKTTGETVLSKVEVRSELDEVLFRP